MYLANKYYISLIGSTSLAYNIYQLLNHYYGMKNISKSFIPISQLSVLLCCYFTNFNETNVLLMKLLSHRLLNNFFPLLIDF